MTKQTHAHDFRLLPISRRDVLRTTGAAGAFAIAGTGFGYATGTAAADDHRIETCGGDVDIVVALDYSGSIRNAGTWSAIEGGVESFLDVVPDDIQLGLVTFGDSPLAYEYASSPPDLLRFANASTIADLKAYIDGLGVPPQENATHIPGALAFADAILDEEGRDGAEIIVLITDGGPNYQNGWVGDGDDDTTVSGFQGPADDQVFSYGSFEFTGGTTGGENGIAGEAGERAETEGIASDITAAGRRIIAVGIGENVAGFDDFLQDSVASDPDDFVPVEDAADLGSELEALISEVCCADCADTGELVKYEFDCVETDEYDDCVRWDFVPEGMADPHISYMAGSYWPEGSSDPMEVTFETGYCELYALVKSGQEFEVQSFEDIDGSFTVETANDEKYAISFVAFYCTEDAAQAALESFPSRGRGKPSPSIESDGGKGRGRK